MDSVARNIPAIILAAGKSGRMGTPKPLLDFAGLSMIARVIESLIAANIHSIFVITGHESQRVAAAVAPYNITAVHNPNYAAGEMLSSIHAGITALPQNIDAFLLVLGDQPAVGPGTIRTLVNSWIPGTPLIIPTHNARRGHPLLIAQSLIPEILALQNDQTLRDVVHRHLAAAIQLPVDDPAVIADIDTPADYQNALAEWKKFHA